VGVEWGSFQGRARCHWRNRLLRRSRNRRPVRTILFRLKKLRDCEAKLTNWSNIDVQICIVTLNQSVFTLATFCLQKCKGQSSLLALAT